MAVIDSRKLKSETGRPETRRVLRLTISPSKLKFNHSWLQLELRFWSTPGWSEEFPGSVSQLTVQRLQTGILRLNPIETVRLSF